MLLVLHNNFLKFIFIYIFITGDILKSLDYVVPVVHILIDLKSLAAVSPQGSRRKWSVYGVRKLAATPLKSAKRRRLCVAPHRRLIPTFTAVVSLLIAGLLEL